MFNKLRSQSGVTLIEIMITVVIVGIMASMAVPRFQEAYERMKFRSTNKEITSALRLARSMSVTNKRYYGIHFDYTTREMTYFLKDAASANLDKMEETDSVLSVKPLIKELSYLNTSMINQAIVFKPNGGATFLGYGFIVTMSSSQDMVGIYVNHVLGSTGRVKGRGYYY